MKPSEKLIERLKKQLAMDLPGGTTIKTLHTGRHQKASGAWSWMLWNQDHTANWVTSYGSCYTVTELLRSKKLAILRDTHSFTYEIMPE